MYILTPRLKVVYFMKRLFIATDATVCLCRVDNVDLVRLSLFAILLKTDGSVIYSRPSTILVSSGQPGLMGVTPLLWSLLDLYLGAVQIY